MSGILPYTGTVNAYPDALHSTLTVMALQRRTAKREVCFVGRQSKDR